MLAVHEENVSEAIEPFIDDRIIDTLLYPVKSGKEGVLYCATAGPRVDADLVAVKIYKPQRFRSFRDDSMYRSGRAILNQHDARAVAKKTRFGREVGSTMWTDSEYQTLRILHRAGAHVPRPLAHTSGAV